MPRARNVTKLYILFDHALFGPLERDRSFPDLRQPVSQVVRIHGSATALR